MVKDNYHHGNLRQALIDAGIKIINESGEEALSLRKVAAACGVSHAAPYAHFPDKDSLLAAMKDTVTARFTAELEAGINDPSVKTTEDAIVEMGRKYVLFFRENPDYFSFLFNKQGIMVHTDMTEENPEDYMPFLVLRRLYLKYLEENGIDKSAKEQEIEILQTWAVVHGLAAIACMENVNVTIPWEKIAAKAILSNGKKYVHC